MFKEFGLKGKGNDNENNFAIKCEDNIITAESDLAKLFNNYFVNVASKLQEPIINSEFEYLNTFVESKVPNDVEFKIPLTNAAIHFSWLGPELLVCCLAHRGPTGVFLLLRS